MTSVAKGTRPDRPVGLRHPSHPRRFHLWLEDVEVAWVRGEPAEEFTSDISFMDGGMERLLAVTGA